MRQLNLTKILLLALLVGVLFVSVTPVRSEIFCRRHDCSNDMLDAAEDSVLGDERFSWRELPQWTISDCTADTVTPWCVDSSNHRCYEIGLYPEDAVIARICDMEVFDHRNANIKYIPPLSSFSPYALDAENHPRVGLTYKYVIRSCEGAVCGDWGPRAADGSRDYIEIIGADYACFGFEAGARCEKECYAGAPKMFSAIPDCQDPL